MTIERNHLERILELCSDAILVLDESGTVTFSNTAAKDLGEPFRKSSLGANEVELPDRSRVRVLSSNVVYSNSFSLANITHEIRTPLNAIQGMASLALEKAEDLEQREYLEILDQSVQSLTILINTILDFSKIRSNSLELIPVEFEAEKALLEICSPHVYSAEARGLFLPVSIAPGLPRQLFMDKGRLKQIIDNIMSNALKFTSTGYVRFAARKREGDLEIEVEDTGIGISADSLRRIGEPFQQEDPSPTRKYGGVGIGLTITSLLVRSMGGSIEFESELGKGTRVCLRIPHGGRSEEPAVLSEWEFVQDRIVHFGTDEQLLHSYDGIAEDMNLALSFAGSQEEVEKFLPEECFVFVSLQLPESGGVIRNLADRGYTVVPVMERRSGKGTELENIESNRLSMPFGPRALTTVLKRAAGKTRPTTRQNSLESIRILVVEDEVLNLLALARMLEDMGATILKAQRVLEAEKLLRTEEVDIALVDIGLPEISGLELARKIRSGEIGTVPTTLPLIALTAYSGETDRMRMRKSGFDEIIIKPYSPIVVQEQLRSAYKNLKGGEVDPEKGLIEAALAEAQQLLRKGDLVGLDALVQGWGRERYAEQLQSTQDKILRLKMAIRKEDLRNIDEQLRAIVDQVGGAK